MHDPIQFTPHEIIAAMRTARAAGAVGRNAITPRYLVQHFPTCSVLDFGCGAAMVHRTLLESSGFDYHCHDFGLADHGELHRGYDVVFASNVLNVQTSIGMLTRTIRQAVCCLKPSGVLLANYPASPRKIAGLTAGDMQGILCRHFCEVVRVGGTTGAPLWQCVDTTGKPGAI